MKEIIKEQIWIKSQSQIEITGIKENFTLHQLKSIREIAELNKIELSFFDNTNLIKESLIDKKIRISFEIKDDSTKFKKEIVKFNLYGYIEYCSLSIYEVENIELKHYQVIVSPFIKKLDEGKKRRIFQKKSCIDIVEEIFKERNYNDFKFQLKDKGIYKKSEYTTQYDESDLNFILRILEQNNIFYLILNNDEKKVQEVIFSDNSSIFKKITDDGLKPVYRFSNKDNFKEIYIPIVNQEVLLDSILLHSYNYKIPKTNLVKKKKGKYGDFFSIFEEKYETPSEGEKILTAILNSKKISTHKYESFLRRPINIGDKFKIKESQIKEYNGEFIVAKQEIIFDKDKILNHIHYFSSENDYAAERKFKKPIVHGSQLGVVVGNESDNVYVNKMATIRVQFYWDQYNKNNLDSSNDIRVAQLFGGKSGKQGNAGAWFLPRVGQEVLVTFINGDPDQPIVTGTVYNGTNPSPFDGKESSEGFTKSGIKTCSIPDGDKGHELIFEDKKDAEKITLSSTKDFELLVENDSKFMIKKNSHGEIEEGDATFEIKKGNKKVTLKEGNYTINVVKGELTIETEKNISIKAKGDILLESEKNIDMKAKSISLKAENDIKLKADNSYSTEAQNIKLNSSLATEIKASTSLKITGGASANIKAPTVAIASDTTFEMKGAIGKIEASGPLEIKGAITKLN